MVTRIGSSSTEWTWDVPKGPETRLPEACCEVRQTAVLTVLLSELPLACVPVIAATLEHEGARVLTPMDTLQERPRQGCLLVMGTTVQFAAAEAAMAVQSPGCSASTAELRLFAELANSRPRLDAIAGKRSVAIGGLIDCDTRPSGVRDHLANITGHAWNLLENRSDFLVVTGLSNPTALQTMACSLAAVSTCPVVPWPGNSGDIFPTLPSSPLTGASSGTPAEPGVVFAMWHPRSAGGLMSAVMSARADTGSVLVTAEVPAVLAGVSADNWKWPDGLPRLDAVVLCRQWLSGVQPAVLARTVAGLFERGTRVFITEAPELVARVLDDVLTTEP